MPRFAVETELTVDDMLAAQRIEVARARARKPPTTAWPETAAGVALAIVGAVLAVRARWIVDDAIWAVALLMLLAFAVGATAMLNMSWRSHRLAARRLYETARLVAEPRRFVFDDAGLEVLGKTADARWRWAAITEAQIRDGLLLLHADVSRTIIIPTRAFADAGEAERALAFVRSRITSID